MLKVVGELIRIRKAKKLTQTDLAKKLGIPQSSIGRVENGSVDVKLSRFVDLARVLDLEVVLVPRKKLKRVRALLDETEPEQQEDLPGELRKFSDDQYLVEDDD